MIPHNSKEQHRMSPRPSADQIAALRARIAAASQRRERQKAEALEAIEREFWTAVAAEISGEGSYFGIQKDIAEQLGITRETVRTQIKKYADPGKRTN